MPLGTLHLKRATQGRLLERIPRVEDFQAALLPAEGWSAAQLAARFGELGLLCAGADRREPRNYPMHGIDEPADRSRHAATACDERALGAHPAHVSAAS